MRKILLFAAVAVLLAVNVQAAALLVNVTGVTTSQEYAGRTLTNHNDYVLQSVQFPLDGDVTGCYVAIDDTQGAGNGGLNCTINADAGGVLGAQLGGGYIADAAIVDKHNNYIALDDPVPVVTATTYWIQIMPPTFPASGNYYEIDYNDANPYAGGQMAKYRDGAISYGAPYNGYDLRIAILYEPSASMILTLISPANETHNNSDLEIKFNNTIDSNCSLLINGSVNATGSDLAADTDQWFNVSMVQDGSYIYQINCIAGDVAANTSQYVFIYDTTQPFIYTSMPNEANTTGLYIWLNKTLQLDAYTEDEYLYKVNFTIYNSTGGVYYNNYTDVSGLGWTRYDWNASIDTSAWPYDRYFALFEASDSHTDEKLLADFKPKKDDALKKLTYYSTEIYGDVTLDFYLKEGDCVLSDFYDLEKIDRHSPVYEFDDCKKMHKETFVVISDKPLKYLSKTDDKYKMHLVSRDGMRGIWFDANLVNDPGADYKIKWINDSAWEITITTEKDRLEFESIGGLNYNSLLVSFYKYVNVTITLNHSVTGAALSNWTILVNGSSTFIGGNQSIKPLIYGARYLFGASKAGFSVPSEYHTIPRVPSFINLTAYEAGTVVYIYDEETGDKILEPIDITIYGNGTHYTRETDTGELYMSAIPLGVYNITFSSGNYTPRTYILTVSNFSTTYMTVYLMRNTNTMIMTIVDRDTQNPIEGAIVTITKYINDTETVIAVLPSDVTGRILFAYGTTTHYIFYITHADYQSRTFELNPVKFSTYTVPMTKILTVSDTSDYAGISFILDPQVFATGVNNLTVVLGAPYGNLEAYTVNLSYPGGSATYSNTNIHGEIMHFDFNITSPAIFDTVNVTFMYDLTGQDKIVHFYQFPISTYDIAGTMTSTEDYGIAPLERILIVTVITLGISGVAAFFTGPYPAVIVGVLILGFFVKAGFISALIVAIPILGGIIYIITGART